MKRCAECDASLRLGHRYCDCGAVLCNGCRDTHVAECDGINEAAYDAGLGLDETYDDDGGEA